MGRRYSSAMLSGIVQVINRLRMYIMKQKPEDSYEQNGKDQRTDRDALSVCPGLSCRPFSGPGRGCQKHDGAGAPRVRELGPELSGGRQTACRQRQL